MITICLSYIFIVYKCHRIDFLFILSTIFLTLDLYIFLALILLFYLVNVLCHEPTHDNVIRETNVNIMLLLMDAKPLAEKRVITFPEHPAS